MIIGLHQHLNFSNGLKYACALVLELTTSDSTDGGFLGTKRFYHMMGSASMLNLSYWPENLFVTESMLVYLFFISGRVARSCVDYAIYFGQKSDGLYDITVGNCSKPLQVLGTICFGELDMSLGVLLYVCGQSILLFKPCIART